MKVIRIFNVQPVKIPQNKHGDPIFLLHFCNVHIMNINSAKFQKSLMVEHFKGITLSGRFGLSLCPSSRLVGLQQKNHKPFVLKLNALISNFPSS